jgi:hypothetical protein
MIVSSGPPPGPPFRAFFQSIPFNAVFVFYSFLVFTNPSPYAVFILDDSELREGSVFQSIPVAFPPSPWRVSGDSPLHTTIEL